jgi:hypothetical protein
MHDDSFNKLSINEKLVFKEIAKLLLLMEKGEHVRTNIVPFIGAGVTSAVDSNISTGKIIKLLKIKFDIPDWIENKLGKLSLYLDIMGIDPNLSCRTVAKYIEEQEESHKCQFFLDKNNNKTYNPLWYLANLPIPVYITTNYDTLLEKYLTNAGKRPQTIVSNWMNWFDSDRNTAHYEIDRLKASVDIDNATEFDKTGLNDCITKFNLINWQNEYTPDNPVVFHLHGVASYPETMVLSEDHYIDILVSLGNTRTKTDCTTIPVLPASIAHAFISDIIMFLGYSLEDIDLHVLLRLSRTNRHREYWHYSVQLEPTHQAIVKLLLWKIFESALADGIDPLEYFRKKLSEKDVLTMKKSIKITFDSLHRNRLHTKVIWSNVGIFLDALIDEYQKMKGTHLEC